MATGEAVLTRQIDSPDAVLIGSGIMSATLGAMLKVLEPALRLQMFEVTTEPAQESSHGWNNAGTGHAGLCELSYTPNRSADGAVDVSKAITIFEQFEASRQFWAFAAEHGMVPEPEMFIRAVPHLSFVEGAETVDFLRARHEALTKHPFFDGMRFTDDPEIIQS
ncbi:MAG: malate:quinone oxidoreductase, partial [Rhodospirillales bacterium]|nr:malate:quinone oxidoreductase [Acetobacter sp.]